MTASNTFKSPITGITSLKFGNVGEDNHVHVAIVGAGPRGTSALERLCSSAVEIFGSAAELTVHIVDPSPPGAGMVWRIDQSSELLMNTVTSQVTLFTDNSVVCAGPIRPGPSLYDWAREAIPELGPDDYATRSQYGGYLEWVFAEVVRRAPLNIRIQVHVALAVRVNEAVDGSQILTLSTGENLPDLAAVVLAQGHLPLRPDPELQKLSNYASENALRYFPPSNPADIDLSVIAPGESVLLRGLGLNFFDHMALLTTGRGGRFSVSSNGQLAYHPSGNEPHMFAGSRRGIPYHARGDNAKGAFGRHMPLVLTDDVIAGFHKRTKEGHAPDFLKEIWPLAAKEVEIVYYEALLRARQNGVSLATSPFNFRKRFLAVPHNSRQEAQLLEEFGVSKGERWSWERIQKPQGSRTFSTAEAWKSWMIGYLQTDAKEAALGNLDGPLKAALDVMRDIRNELRLIVDHDGVKGTSYRDHLDRWYTPLNAFLSIGPPRQRIEQMVALMEAGVLEVLGPQLQVHAKDGVWQASSPSICNWTVQATTLIEARLPEPNLRHTADDLLSRMFKSGQCRPHILDGYETGGMDITNSPYHIIDAQGRAHPRRFAVGVPTEGVHWVTAAGARPGVNSVTLADTDAVARAALQAARSEMRQAYEPALQTTSLPMVVAT
ncbi:FAD-dependent oxidoreductase protein [Pochonia chlamydosporia 170]|uniref:FAD-dependent oxidoreductase protein n=1 Tax=Pochonia chlamydosporia 170 TaxID=1380566 RepID=A0A179F4K8_METCM|nr:FAD-dependent oxidoreductase protein [Pochonia chlamydosporia 170]OAQ60367.1 FAD-dependent oxidoreductase protein [Pochonia chlamydosporia 170]